VTNGRGSEHVDPLAQDASRLNRKNKGRRELIIDIQLGQEREKGIENGRSSGKNPLRRALERKEKEGFESVGAQ